MAYINGKEILLATVVQTVEDSEMKARVDVLEDGLASQSVKTQNHEKRIINLEKGLPEDNFATDDTVAVVKNVPSNALPYAAVTRVGGMSIAADGIVRHAKVTAVKSVGTNADIERLEIPQAVRSLDGYGYGVNGECFNYIDFEGMQFVKRVEKVDISTLAWSYDGANKFFNVLFSKRKGGANFLCDLYEKISAKTDAEMASADNMTICSNNDDSGAWLNIKNTAYADVASFKAAMQGVYLYYEAQGVSATDIDDILAEDNLIEVEGGGTLTFVNEHGSAVPSSVTYQLKEVSE